MGPVREETTALGPFRLDMSNRRLFRDGVSLELRPQAFRALQVLIENRGHLVPYSQLIREAWAGLQVSKHTVAVTVNEVKDALGSYGAWITCRPRLGYLLEIPETNELIRRGWHFLSLYTRAGFENALQCFQRAAQTDGADLQAFSGMTSTYLMLGGFLIRAPRRIRDPFQAAYERAVALSGLTPELRADRAWALLIFGRQPGLAEAELQELRRLAPGLPQVHIRLALAHMALGQLESAATVIRQAQASAVLFPELTFTGTLLRLFRREFEQGVQWGRDNLDLHPASQVGRVFYAEALEHAGRPAEALAQYRLAAAMSPDISWIRAQEARFLARQGHASKATAVLHQLQRNREIEYVDAYFLALLLHALGKTDEAFEELDRARDEDSYALLFVDVDPKADGLRKSPQFELWRRMGLSNRDRWEPSSPRALTHAAAEAGSGPGLLRTCKIPAAAQKAAR